MESKIETTLRQMGGILSDYYPPSHAKLYALKRFGIEGPKVHHNDRKNKLTGDDRNKLLGLYDGLNGYVEQYGVGPFQKYYVNLWQKKSLQNSKRITLVALLRQLIASV